MKNLKVIVAIIAISLSSVVSVSAKNTEPTSTKEAKTVLRAKIVKLLGHHQYDLNDQTLKAEVSVMLNNKNELVVISVDTKNNQVESFVTKKLNYKKINIKGIEKGTVYRMPLKIK